MLIFLFYLNQLDISQNFMHILTHVILIYVFFICTRSILYFFHLQKYLDNKVNLSQKFIGNLPLVVCVPILIVFCQYVGMIYTLAYQCFKICSNWTRFHEELHFVKYVFLKNGYPLSFIDKCFKIVINKLVIKHCQVTTAEKKTLILSLPYLGDVSLQSRN